MRNRTLLTTNVLLALILLVLGTVGCGKDETTESVAEELHQGEPLTDEECVAFAKEMEEAAASGNAFGFSKLIDLQAIVDQTMAGIEISEKNRKAFFNGVKQDLLGSSGVSGQIKPRKIFMRMIRIWQHGQHRRQMPGPRFGREEQKRTRNKYC